MTVTNRLVDQLSAPCFEKLQHYVMRLDHWRKTTNLISERSFADIWARHIEDSLLVQSTSPASSQWLDIGSGAGLPGLVIAVALADRQVARVHCIESDSRKCAFLRSVADELKLPVKVHNVRVETISEAQTGAIEAVTARAFASIEKILSLARTYLDAGAIAVLPRGFTSYAEIEAIDAKRYITVVRANPGDGKGTIVSIRQRVTAIDV